MKELIGIAILVGTLFAGTKSLNMVLKTVQREALTKAAHGLPPLTNFAAALEGHK